MKHAHRVDRPRLEFNLQVGEAEFERRIFVIIAEPFAAYGVSSLEPAGFSVASHGF
jgi:hypothetical protein